MSRAFARLLLAALAVFAFALPALALPPTFTQVALREATSASDLRGRLLAHARGAGVDKISAGEAWFYAGQSWARGGKADSTVVAYRKAIEMRGTFDDRYFLADALLDRQAPGDIDEAIKVITATLPEAQTESPRTATKFQALLAWAKLLAGEKDESRTIFAAVEADITRDHLWRYRSGRAVLTGPDTGKGIMMLRPLAVASRVQATDVMELLERAAQRVGQSEALDKDLADKLELRDQIEERVVTRVGGRRLKFLASDKFPLAGVLLEAEGSGKHRAAIVMMAPEDTLADFDSLAVTLRAMGHHTLLVSPRGSGWSVAPACPLPYAWRHREDELLRRSALDVHDAMRAVALAARADTSSIVLVCSRSMALAGAMAAARNPRVRVLVMLSPDPDPVDRGVVVATLAKRRLPVFIQQTMEDYPNFEFVDLAYHATQLAASRVSDGRSGGHGAIAFRQDRRITPRFVQWLAEAWKAAPPATPRSQPRKG